MGTARNGTCNSESKSKKVATIVVTETMRIPNSQLILEFPEPRVFSTKSGSKDSPKSFCPLRRRFGVGVARGTVLESDSSRKKG